MDIDAFVTQYLVSRSPETRKAYRADLRKFKRFLEERNLTVTVLPPADITAFVQWLGKWRNCRTGRRGLSEASIQRHIAAVRAWFEWLRYDDPGLRDPTVLFHYHRTSEPALIHPISTDPWTPCARPRGPRGISPSSRSSTAAGSGSPS